MINQYCECVCCQSARSDDFFNSFICLLIFLGFCTIVFIVDKIMSKRKVRIG